MNSHLPTSSLPKYQIVYGVCGCFGPYFSLLKKVLCRCACAHVFPNSTNSPSIKTEFGQTPVLRQELVDFVFRLSQEEREENQEEKQSSSTILTELMVTTLMVSFDLSTFVLVTIDLSPSRTTEPFKFLQAGLR